MISYTYTYNYRLVILSWMQWLLHNYWLPVCIILINLSKQENHLKLQASDADPIWAIIDHVITTHACVPIKPAVSLCLSPGYSNNHSPLYFSKRLINIYHEFLHFDVINVLNLYKYILSATIMHIHLKCGLKLYIYCANVYLYQRGKAKGLLNQYIEAPSRHNFLLM